jgi:hypothetical protein
MKSLLSIILAFTMIGFMAVVVGCDEKPQINKAVMDTTINEVVLDSDGNHVMTNEEGDYGGRPQPLKKLKNRLFKRKR